MDIKERQNHELYLKILRKMTNEERLQKAFDFSESNKALFKQGLRERFPDLSEAEFKKLYFERLALCHNRNW